MHQSILQVKCGRIYLFIWYQQQERVQYFKELYITILYIKSEKLPLLVISTHILIFPIFLSDKKAFRRYRRCKGPWSWFSCVAVTGTDIRMGEPYSNLVRNITFSFAQMSLNLGNIWIHLLSATNPSTLPLNPSILPTESISFLRRWEHQDRPGWLQNCKQH